MKNLLFCIILLLTISCDLAKEIIGSAPDAKDAFDELDDICYCYDVEYKNYGNGWAEDSRVVNFEKSCEDDGSQVGEPEAKVDANGNQYQSRIDLECESSE